jgi:mycobactin salicyl-AMP ligase
MTALARAADDSSRETAVDQFGWSAGCLSGLLSGHADRHPDRVAFVDQDDRQDWSGRPRITYTYRTARGIVERLATFLEGLRLPQGACVGVCLPNSSEACLTVMAVEQAGLIPCLLPVGWSEELLGQAIEVANVAMVICQGSIADEQPVESFCRLAARYFGLRFVCAFGPHVPDGVIDLDRAIVDTQPRMCAPEGEAHSRMSGLVTFQLDNGSPRPVFRSHPSVIAAAVHFLVTQNIDARDRILTLLPPDDHRSLTTGLVASLVTGAALECHGLFGSASLNAALYDTTPTHLVAPGWMEGALAAAELPDTVRTVILLHQAPVRFKAQGELRRHTVDVLGFGELALVARARTGSGHLAFFLDEDGPVPQSVASDLLKIRRDEDGSISFAGFAADVQDLDKGVPQFTSRGTDWRPSGFQVDLFAGTVIGVR